MALQTKAQHDLFTEVYEQFKLSKRYVDPIHERMNQQEELYRSFIDSNTYVHSAKVFDPRVFRVVETVTPRMVANEPTGSYFPREYGDMITVQLLNALIRFDWQNANMFEKLVRFVKSMLIFGTAFGYNYWDHEEGTRKRMKAIKQDGTYVWSMEDTEEVPTVISDKPNFETLNIYDCFPDPNATDLESMRWFIFRQFKTIEELENEKDLGDPKYAQNIKKLKRLIRAGGSDQGDAGGVDSENMQYREHRRTMLNNQEFKGKDDSNKDIVVLRRFMRDSWVDIVPEYGLILRDSPNRYMHGELPIVYGVDYVYPGELFGMGEIEPIERIQRAINAVLNQRLDNVQLVLKNMWKVKKGAGVDLHTLVSAPGNILTMDELNAVEQVTIPDVTGPTFVQTMNYLTSSLQNGSGVTDYTIGMGNRSNVANKTATGTRLIQQEANAQFKLKLQLFNKMVIERIANQWKDLRLQYTTEEQLVRIVGKDLVSYLTDHTDLQKVSETGEPILPGDYDTPTKLQVSGDKSFAFLKLYPEDIQSSIVGDYDFIAAPSSEQLHDPVAMQENFFTALERVSNPDWVKGLAAEGKTLNYSGLTAKVFDKLSIGLEDNDILMDLPKQQQAPAPQAPDADISQILGAANLTQPQSPLQVN